MPFPAIMSLLARQRVFHLRLLIRSFLKIVEQAIMAIAIHTVSWSQWGMKDYWVKFPEFEPKERPRSERPTELSSVASRNLDLGQVAKQSKSSIIINPIIHQF